jgi:hypothetical protein
MILRLGQELAAPCSMEQGPKAKRVPAREGDLR